MNHSRCHIPEVRRAAARQRLKSGEALRREPATAAFLTGSALLVCAALVVVF
jgi:hypothetical protein